ncbi:MAG: TlpA disulfide reductase family protein [Nitrospirota bacterium]
MAKVLSKISAVCCIMLFLSAIAPFSDAYALSIGEKVPNVTLKDVSGSPVSLDKFRGKIVLINFWATWCPSCKYELRYLNELQKKHDELVVLAISIDKDQSSCSKFISKNPANFTILTDPDGIAVNAFKGRAMPTSYILDKEGAVRYIHFGFNEDKDPALWEKEINELKGGKI